MMGFNHCRVLSLCLLGSVFLVACTRRQHFWVSPTVREIEEVRRRTVPSNGSLLRVSEPVRNTLVFVLHGRFRQNPTIKRTFNGSRISSARSIT